MGAYRNKIDADKINDLVYEGNDITVSDIKSKFLMDLTDNILKQLEVTHSSVYLYNEELNMLTLYFSLVGDKNLCKGMEVIKIDEGMPGYTFTNRKSIKIQSINDICIIRNKDVFIKNNIKYIGSYPICYDDKVIGVLLMGYEEADKIDKDINLKMDKLCKEIAVLLNNTILYKQLKDEFTIRELKEKELQLFFNTAKDLLCIMDGESRLKTVSSEWMNVLGWTEEELLNMKLDDLIYFEDRDRVKETILGNRDKKVDVVSGYRYRLLCKDGSYRWISWNSRVLNEENLIICTGRDITDEIIMEEKNRELQKVIELEVVKNQFFANISHEFRTPLNILLSSMQLVKQNIEKNKIRFDDDIDLNQYINSVKKNTYRLLKLTNNLIDMTEIDMGNYKLNLGNYDIVSIVEDTTLSIVEYINSKGMELTFDTDIEEFEVACDSEAIERIMLNLLSNAVKYSEIGGKIEVKLKKSEDNILVFVIDKGIGIDLEKQAMIFNRFSQVNDVFTKRAEGSGIGLSLVKSLIELHGGTIEVKSEIGMGSKFIFNIPIKNISNCNVKDSVSINLNSKLEKGKIEFSDI